MGGKERRETLMLVSHTNKSIFCGFFHLCFCCLEGEKVTQQVLPTTPVAQVVRSEVCVCELDHCNFSTHPHSQKWWVQS